MSTPSSRDVSLGSKGKMSNGGQNLDVTSFQVLSKIGQGGFGTVLLVRRYANGQIYAMKVLLKSDMQEGDAQRVVDEGKALAEIRHPFVVQLLFAFHDDRHVYFVLEYHAGGDLASYIDNIGTLSEGQCQVYVAEIALALEAVHARGFVYRDLKPDNLLLGCDGHLALADFGLAKKLNKGAAGKSRGATTFCGTPAYMAPEQFLHETYGVSVDWWALGLVYSEMLLGDLGLVEPFNNENYQTVLKSFKRGKFLQDMSGADGLFSDASLDLRSRFLCVEPEGRICCGPKGFDELKEHPFMQTLDFEKLLKKEIKGPLADHYGDVKVKALRPQSIGASKQTETKTEMRMLDELFEQFTAAPEVFSASTTSETTWSTMLCDAASKNETKTLTELIAHGAQVDASDYDKRTAIHLVCSEGGMEVLRLLVAHGANVNPVDRWGNTPLDDAERSGHKEVVAWLKTHGAVSGGGQVSHNRSRKPSGVMSTADRAAFAPLLCEAASRNDMRALKELVGSTKVEGGAKPDANFGDYDKRTALHLAASEGHVEAVRFLVEVGDADVNSRDRWGNTPLDDAKRSTHGEVEAYLESVGGEMGAYFTFMDGLKAAAAGDIIALRVLVAQGLNVKLKRKTDGASVLHCAAASGHFDTVHFLSVDCPGVDIDAVNNDGKTACDLAAASNNGSIASYLQKLKPGPPGVPNKKKSSSKKKVHVLQFANTNGGGETGDAKAMKKPKSPSTPPSGKKTMSSRNNSLKTMSSRNNSFNSAKDLLQTVQQQEHDSEGGESSQADSSTESPREELPKVCNGLPTKASTCPLTRNSFTDPVVAEDGISYERSAIETFFTTYGPFSPCTHNELETTAVYSNFTLKMVLDQQTPLITPRKFPAARVLPPGTSSSSVGNTSSGNSVSLPHVEKHR